MLAFIQRICAKLTNSNHNFKLISILFYDIITEFKVKIQGLAFILNLVPRHLLIVLWLWRGYRIFLFLLERYFFDTIHKSTDYCCACIWKSVNCYIIKFCRNCDWKSSTQIIFAGIIFVFHIHVPAPLFLRTKYRSKCMIY